MNGAANPTRPGGTYRVPPAITTKTLTHLRRHSTEAVCFWLGRALETVIAIEELWIPKFKATTISYDIEPREMLRLKGYLDQTDQVLLAQIHSHPGSAFHSSTDDMNAASPWPGYISVVVPNFGNIADDFWDEVEAYELLGGGEWRHLDSTERHARFFAREAK
jgi:proteasome lid subunit RPN8/RPN11